MLLYNFQQGEKFYYNKIVHIFESSIIGKRDNTRKIPNQKETV